MPNQSINPTATESHTIAGLSHVNIRAPEALVERLRAFYRDVIGLREGPRPPFRSRGHWFCAGARDVLHLTVDPRVERAAGDGWLDHIAFSAIDLETTIALLENAGVAYERDDVPSLGQVQLFLIDPAGIGVELNFEAREQNAMNLRESWLVYALGSAFFAALTALFGKIGVAGIPSNLATLIRTAVILGVTAALVAARNEWRAPATIEARTWLFLVFSGIATGLSWLCYYRALQLGPVSKVAPIDKLSVAIAIVLGVVFLGESLSWPVAIGGGLILLGSIVLVVF